MALTCVRAPLSLPLAADARHVVDASWDVLLDERSAEVIEKRVALVACHLLVLLEQIILVLRIPDTSPYAATDVCLDHYGVGKPWGEFPKFPQILGPVRFWHRHANRTSKLNSIPLVVESHEAVDVREGQSGELL